MDLKNYNYINIFSIVNMFFTNFCISLVLFLFFSIKRNTTRMIIIIIKIIIIILNTDIPATRPVHPVCELLDEEITIIVIRH